MLEQPRQAITHIKWCAFIGRSDTPINYDNDEPVPLTSGGKAPAKPNQRTFCRPAIQPSLVE
jgi:hypothetical protein